jgi:S-adenosylmethionine synthetase
VAEEKIVELLMQHFDFRLAGILKQFNLKYQPLILKGGFYRKLAAYGHMGRMDIGLPWEMTDKAQTLKAAS